MENRRIKIVYIITKGNWGGAQKYVFDLATSLPKDVFNVSVVLGQGEILEKKLREHGVEVFKILEMGRDISIFKEMSTFLAIFKILKKERPDIVHLNSSKAAGIGALTARMLSIPKIVFTVHGWYFNEPVGKIKKVVTRFLSWLTVLFSTDVIVLSVDNLRQAATFPFSKNKTYLIYNGLNKASFKNKVATRKFIAEVTGADPKKLWAVTISELHKNKGLEYIIRALSSLKEELVFFIIGEGEERESLENLVKELNLENNIYLMGYIDEAAKHLKAFDLFTLTSVKEGHPYTILEAGLAKLPVLGSNIPGIKDILGGEAGVLVESKNSEEIGRWLSVLVNDKKKMAQLGANLHAKVLKDFSFEKSLKETIKVYRD